MLDFVALVLAIVCVGLSNLAYDASNRIDPGDEVRTEESSEERVR